MGTIRIQSEIPGPRGRAILERRARAVAAGLGKATDVVRAIAAQAQNLIHPCALVTTHESYVRLAELLNEITPGSFAKKTLLGNSGAEAVENAVKLARRFTGRP